MAGFSTAQTAATIAWLSSRVFLLLVLVIIGGAILRSAIATRLDDFTLDEPYHIVAGVSYVERGDFRINPEHPPLVKLWVGTVASALGFSLAPFRELNDKAGERKFANEAVYIQNDPVTLQHRARIAMWILNSLFLLLFAFALRRTFGATVALGTLLFLAIDPTVAAHLPVVMTDLPIALLSASTVLLGARAFVTWKWSDLAQCSVVLGCALATKHSAPVFCIILTIAGTVLLICVRRERPSDTHLYRFAKLAAVFLGAFIILWGFYRFRFTESATSAETFNRPLSLKIADLRSSTNRYIIAHLNSAHLLPRAYIWGLADTVRGGVEGRVESRLCFGKPVLKAPIYFFPGVVTVKLPIGLDILLLSGLALFFSRRLPREWDIHALLLLFSATGYFFVLAHGASYAGMRHALPAMVLLSTFGGFAIHTAVVKKDRWLSGVVTLAIFAAAASALFVMRPWEYYNELVGGSEHAYLYFNDEGVDLYQRNLEIARYYHDYLEPDHDIPFLQYIPYDEEAEYLHLDWVSHDMNRDERYFQNPVFTGTVIVQARYLGPGLFGDWAALRNAKPVARFGDVMVFHGAYNIAPILAADREYRARLALFADIPDPVNAEHLFRQAVEFDPSCFYNFIELGDIYLDRGSRAQALEAFTAARDHSPAGSPFRHQIDEQLRLLSSSLPIAEVPRLRDPTLE